MCLIVKMHWVVLKSAILKNRAGHMGKIYKYIAIYKYIRRRGLKCFASVSGMSFQEWSVEGGGGLLIG